MNLHTEAPLRSAPLSHRWRLAYRLLLAAIAIACVLLFAGGTSPADHRLTNAIWNSGHLLLPGALALLAGLRLRGPGIVGKLVVTVVVAAVVGLAVEFIQLWTGRDFSLDDVALDVLGAYIGMLAGAHRQLLAAARWLAVALCLPALIGMALIAVPFAGVAWDSWQAQRQFPLLAGFASPLERDRFRNDDRTALDIAAGRMAVALQPRVSSGFFLDDFPHDWRGYRSLLVDYSNPDADALSMRCRIHDRTHNNEHSDRYNQRFSLPPGRGRIRIDLQTLATAPAGRPMDMSGIMQVGCFALELERPRTLFLHSIRLE